MIRKPAAAPATAGRTAARRLRRTRRQLPPRWRKLLLTAHVAVTVGWFGTVLGALALGISGRAATDPVSHRAPYQILDLFDSALMRPLAVSVFLTSIPLSIWTKWGLLRHYWVMTKLTLTTVILVFAVFFQSQWIHAASHRIAQPGFRRVGEPLETLLIFGPVLIGVLLAPQIVLSIYKPWGKTRRGRTANAVRLG